MKYVSLFENFEDYLSKKVDQNTFYHSYKKRIKERFTNKELDKIKLLFSGESRVNIIELNIDRDYKKISGIYNFDSKSKHKLQFEIFKGDDEWFYLNINFGSFYICDSIDGVSQIINSFLLKKN